MTTPYQRSTRPSCPPVFRSDSSSIRPLFDRIPKNLPSFHAHSSPLSSRPSKEAQINRQMDLRQGRAIAIGRIVQALSFIAAVVVTGVSGFNPMIGCMVFSMLSTGIPLLYAVIAGAINTALLGKNRKVDKEMYKESIKEIFIGTTGIIFANILSPVIYFLSVCFFQPIAMAIQEKGEEKRKKERNELQRQQAQLIQDQKEARIKQEKQRRQEVAKRGENSLSISPQRREQSS